LYDAEQRRFVPRDAEAEKAASGLLYELGFRVPEPSYMDREPGWQIAPKKLPRVLRTLVEAGWHVEAEGKMLRRAGQSRVAVTSGIDWFELRGEVEFGETSAKLPQLLAALHRGEKMVLLDDGTYGMLPEEWLAKFGPLMDFGDAQKDHLRFRRNQTGLLDALLSTQPEARFDEEFARAREELRRFEGIRAAEQPAGFAGRLRDYQKEGLGWMDFLRRFGFGGCLADDMGVGKTAQVLALLEQRRSAQTSAHSLIIVPKSLIFNWKQEAARFTPQLRVLDYTGLARNIDERDGFDVILTTYGTLRRDILSLREVEFDYIVLDEAQAIKNSQSESAKAARLLSGRHKLALSGTPVENHLGELWSLFEFLNPGMLGSSKVLKGAAGLERNPDEGTRKLLAQGLRPFILRRTKDQVARELPQKTEQTIYCVMDPPQRKLYDELRKHYRLALLNRIDKDGMGKSKMHVLEALLRLRQAACHPALLDPARSGDPSAKLEVLIAHLAELADQGHKALVFSQFTSLLKIVRDRLDENGTVYEYLDGATRNRQARVERFQNDPKCPLFLISLKAGGLGLNLTAAEYVFLLDPWWNPAVEAQAIDRTHRIGQTRQVFAYRLITRDTVEERVVELQDAKRELAAAVFGADNALIRQLKREDLEVLLS
jgi:SNF2 family DNA or RNA helicase